jgi:hypothetical protein
MPMVHSQAWHSRNNLWRTVMCEARFPTSSASVKDSVLQDNSCGTLKLTLCPPIFLKREFITSANLSGFFHVEPFQEQYHASRLDYVVLDESTKLHRTRRDIYWEIFCHLQRKSGRYGLRCHNKRPKNVPASRRHACPRYLELPWTTPNTDLSSPDTRLLPL